MKALITGVTGQDGYYLSKLLNEKGYEVHGLVRRTSKLAKVPEYVQRINGDVLCFDSIATAFITNQYDECYHLAAQSFVGESFNDPQTTMEINCNGTLRVLEAIKQFSPKTRLYFAGTSEQFGNQASPQNELTPMEPVSPYGVSKLAAFRLCNIYRSSYGIFASCGILFNHESPRRGDEFVTKKITNYVRNLLQPKPTCGPLWLGNRNAKRDWGHAKDYVYGMWLMLQHNKPKDFVLATGKLHSVRDFVSAAFNVACIEEKGHVKIDAILYRPNELHELRGDASKAKRVLNWEPTISFEELVKDMVFNDE